MFSRCNTTSEHDTDNNFGGRTPLLDFQVQTMDMPPLEPFFRTIYSVPGDFRPRNITTTR